MWDTLPTEVQDLILEHRAALLVQHTWLRWSRYRHARREAWRRVRDRLGVNLWRRVIPFSLVRREWRLEPDSWAIADANVLQEIIEETRLGLWGSACPHQAAA